MLSHIRKIFYDSRKIYGSVRITDCSHDLGFRVGKNRVSRLMREDGIKPKMLKRYKVTTKSKHKRPTVANLLNQDFTAYYPDQVWTSDITYIWTP